MKKTILTGMLAATILGCGSSTSSTGTGLSAASGGSTTPSAGTGTFDLVFQQEGLPSGIDSVNVLFLDNSGATIFGPLELPISQDVQVPNVPVTATQVQVDYLQNGGYALYESVSPISFSGTLTQRVLAATLGATARVTDPQLRQAGAARSVWKSSVDSTGKAQFTVATQGKPGLDTGLSAQAPFTFKGVGYSPASIGNSNKANPIFGDYFFDGGKIDPTKIFGGQALLDWSKVWGRDLENIRPIFNSLRVYSMIQLQVPDSGIPADLNTLPQFQHRNFLDQCWNDGDKPLFVLVGIPLPSTLMTLSGIQANPNDAAFWLENFRRTVIQLKDHPAVAGFTIFNEQGGSSQWGGNATESTWYWSQIQTLTSIVRTSAPDKLVGFAYFDAPSDVQQANQGGYIAKYGGNLDFFGINSFQSTTVDNTLNPYTQLGAASRPVLFTEFGLPATTHSDPSTTDGTTPTASGSLSITTTSASIAATTSALQFILPVALQKPIVGGMFYFEWNDEWWKQDPFPGVIDTQATRWEGGKKTGAPFPNLFNDEEGYGLNSIALNSNRPNASATFDPFNTSAQTANNFPDVLSPRSTMLNAVKAAFSPPR